MFICENALWLSRPKWLQKLRIIFCGLGHFFLFFFPAYMWTWTANAEDSNVLLVLVFAPCWLPIAPRASPRRIIPLSQLSALASGADPLGEPAVGWCCQVSCHNTCILEGFPYSPFRIDLYFLGITKNWGDWSAFKLFWLFFIHVLGSVYPKDSSSRDVSCTWIWNIYEKQWLYTKRKEI